MSWDSVLGQGARALVGLESLMAPHVYSLNLLRSVGSLPLSLGEPAVPPSGDSLVYFGVSSFTLAGGTIA